MILQKGDPHYIDLPGLSVLIGGMWIANIAYWGFNQYIIQRALAAKNLDEAQKGVIFAAFLKLLMPVIIVLPGIAAVVLAPNLLKPDEAYPTMMRLLPPGLLGLVFAALVAAIIASTASKINSIATIFTLDLYAKFRGERTRAEDDKAESQREERHLVLVGRITAVTAIIIAILVARPLVGSSEQAFQFIQEFSRLLHARHYSDLPARPVLEAGDRGGRDCRGGDVGAPFDAHEIHASGGGISARAERLSDAVHQSHGRGFPCLTGTRGGRLPGDKGAAGHGHDRHRRRALQDEHRLQRRRAGRRADPDRPLRDVVVIWSGTDIVIRRVTMIATLTYGLAGCTYFDQYVYNCTGASIRLLTASHSMGPMSYFGHQKGGGPKYSAADWVQYGDGRVDHPLEVTEHEVLASKQGGQWTLPANVCPQFGPRAVIVDLE